MKYAIRHKSISRYYVAEIFLDGGATSTSKEYAKTFKTRQEAEEYAKPYHWPDQLQIVEVK